MEINEIRGLSDRDLQAALVDAKHELWKIRFDLATRQEKNYSRLPATRKQIARILTVMTERERASVDGAPANGVAVPAAAAPAPARRRRSADSTAAAAPATTATATVDEPEAPAPRRRSRKAS